MSIDDVGSLEIYGFTGPDENSDYTCQRCTGQVYGPRNFVLTHYAAHLQKDLDAMPGCNACKEKLLELQGDPERVTVNEQGALVVEFGAGPWICTNESCERYEVEVTLTAD